MNRYRLTAWISISIVLLAHPLVASPMMAPPDTYLSGIPLAVVPVHDGVSDDVADELRGSVSAALSHQSGIHVVDPKRVAEVMAYHEGPTTEAKSSSILSHAAGLQQRAKEHYLNFASTEALAEIRSALQDLQTASLPMNDKGPVLRDALVTAAVIASDTKDLTSAEHYLTDALKIDPAYPLDGGNYSPRLRDTFLRLQTQMTKSGTGNVSITSDPKVADVYINGVKRGVTPLNLSLPVGNYDLRVAGNRYTSYTQKLQIQIGVETKVSTRLAWEHASPKPSRTSVETNETQALIQEGQRLMDLLRLQKVVLLDVDTLPDGSGEIRARMLDATTKASHRPVYVRFRADHANLQKSMSEMVKVLSAQAVMKRIDNPIAQLDPVGVGDPIVLGRRKGRGITPLGWGVIGGVAGTGAIAGILAAVLSGSNGGSASPAQGSIHVQLSK